MSRIIPEGEAVRKAVKWISNECKENPETRVGLLICQAASKFNLTPKDEEFLRAFYAKEKMAKD